MSQFDDDPFPGRPKILFVGWPNSPHTHSWINLLQRANFNTRIFCLNSTEPPEEWWVKCYQTVSGAPLRNDDKRRTAFPAAGIADLEEALANVIRAWEPDIIHTLGFDPSSFLYLEVLRRFPDAKVGAWVAQARGGSDTALPRYSPSIRPVIEEIFQKCDHFIADNAENYQFAQTAGLAKSKIEQPGMGVVPGPGGLDLDTMRSQWTDLPSKRERLIVWPKAYETPWAKANPVFEGIIQAWDRIKPCRIEMLWMDNPYIQMWYQKLFSEEMRASCVARERVSHDVALDLFAQARVMLAPSLVDGIPNSMMEAMALGAVPIVSPIETIVPVVEDGRNVIFARNLYPDEIAEALVRTMSDDALVDRIATANIEHVKGLADRKAIRQRAITFYDEVAQAAQQRTPIPFSPNRVEGQHRAMDVLDRLLEKRHISEAELAKAAAEREEHERAFGGWLRKAWYDQIMKAATQHTLPGGAEISESSIKLPDGRFIDAKSLIFISGLFDKKYYLNVNNDVADAGHDPVEHFYLHGGSEGRRAGPNFDTALYIEQNPDVAEASINPLIHFILYGALEGRGYGSVNSSLLLLNVK
ncbi:glycosyltransferase family 4 protein [Methylobacterium sp. J-077]|uniref:glycosyltransferase family 4 protein n=1 Tax=Methylobacterium sp. J-077 TaxID=2836656 RepID=UPI001FB876B4|nr:glycosyltransferase family 4 protein [Methylobacterium sp. J-077]MCJ2126407.1 glycosyltransferase family 4 protein [Methylobacterium sp. J-077]